jgi:hypothetical protein
MLLNSECVNEFLTLIESNNTLIKYLGFDSFKSIKDYIIDSDYEEFIELRNETKDYLNKK